MVALRPAEAQLEQRRAVVEESTMNQANLLKRRHAAVNGDQVAHLGPDYFMKLFDAGGTVGLTQCGQNRHAGLGYPEPG